MPNVIDLQWIGMKVMLSQRDRVYRKEKGYLMNVACTGGQCYDVDGVRDSIGQVVYAFGWDVDIILDEIKRTMERERHCLIGEKDSYL